MLNQMLMLNLIILGEIKYLANVKIIWKYTLPITGSTKIKALCIVMYLSESTVAGVFSEIHFLLTTVTLCPNGQSPWWCNQLWTCCICHTPVRSLTTEQEGSDCKFAIKFNAKCPMITLSTYGLILILPWRTHTFVSKICGDSIFQYGWWPYSGKIV